MTVKQARKILGVMARGVSDEQIESDIRVAEFFKNIFFASKFVDKFNRASKPNS